MFAQFYWLCACAFLYGPMSPFFYALAAGYAFFSFACTKFGIVYWYKRPPAITAVLGSDFRVLLLPLLPLHLIIKLVVRLGAEPSAMAGYSVAYFAGAVALCVPLFWVTFASRTASVQGAYTELNETDTKGVRYDEVEAR